MDKKDSDAVLIIKRYVRSLSSLPSDLFATPDVKAEGWMKAFSGTVFKAVESRGVIVCEVYLINTALDHMIVLETRYIFPCLVHAALRNVSNLPVCYRWISPLPKRLADNAPFLLSSSIPSFAALKLIIASGVPLVLEPLLRTRLWSHPRHSLVVLSGYSGWSRFHIYKRLCPCSELCVCGT